MSVQSIIWAVHRQRCVRISHNVDQSNAKEDNEKPATQASQVTAVCVMLVYVYLGK